MSTFVKLDDSPMFRKQIFSLEQTTDELKERCQNLLKGCKKYIFSLQEIYDGDIDFSDSIEAFGSGLDDPLSVSIGGPVLSKFTSVFREIGSYKELLRSQVEHMLVERLMQFMSVELNSVKESRRRFDKSSAAYDQAREKLMSLKKGTRAEVVAELEEDLNNSKSAFERCRFNLVTALTNVETKKKFEFLESFSAIMDAHLRYFKQGFELLKQMEPFIHQVLTFAQQSKEMAIVEQDKLAKQIQEFRTQAEMDSLRSSSNIEASTSGDGIHVVGVHPYKNIEALMQSTANGKVQTIKQGYLLKRSLESRGDLKRRFFVLDSHGTLYYYRNMRSKGSQSQQSLSSLEHRGGMFGRFRFSHSKLPSKNEDILDFHTINLRMSTIKIDAEQSDLLFCFRIISPLKTYTLQAENRADRTDWINKITGVIASLLNAPLPAQQLSGRNDLDGSCAPDAVASGVILANNAGNANSENEASVKRQDTLSNVLRNIPGNDLCADCSAPNPDWASLNLGIIMCIECSGVHRNLGVHISKVRSVTLDVKVWEPTILELFCALGNSFCNSLWEQRLQAQGERNDESNSISLLITKPGPKDAFSSKEKYIHSKYVEKLLVMKEKVQCGVPSLTTLIWEAVYNNNLRATYGLLVASDANPNITYDEVTAEGLYYVADPEDVDDQYMEKMQNNPELCPRIMSTHEPASCLQGCSLLHLACHVGNPVMLELLLQFGADINACDFHGRTPLHHCISKKNDKLAKYLLKKGVDPSIKDHGGQTAMERMMESGAITDEQLFVLLAGND